MEALPRKLYCCVVVVAAAVAIDVVVVSKQASPMEASAFRSNEMLEERA